MSTLRFGYELTTYGWATATIADEQSTVQITTSYVGNALASLLRAVRAAGDDTTQTRHSAILPAEPDNYMWDFWPISDDSLIMSVVHYSMSGGGELPRHGESGTVIFEMNTNWRHVASTIARTADTVQQRYGDGYEELWRQPFPSRDLSRLTDLLATRAATGDG